MNIVRLAFALSLLPLTTHAFNLSIFKIALEDNPSVVETNVPLIIGTLPPETVDSAGVLTLTYGPLLEIDHLAPLPFPSLSAFQIPSYHALPTSPSLLSSSVNTYSGSLTLSSGHLSLGGNAQLILNDNIHVEPLYGMGIQKASEAPVLTLDATAVPVPEPSTYALAMGLGSLILLMLRRLLRQPLTPR